ncbi:MAG TPA: 3-phosphoshikimate 1-carboxyvinyltransferase [Acidimicrobiia bacterium]|nr:3-phosphoshikimate 1-carboxyvinyltransferase [Acidimicrobiia bacterium]
MTGEQGPRGAAVDAPDAPDVLTVGGARPLVGRLRVPGDKSISHRSLIFAAIAEGSSRITGLATGADVRATARVLGQLGVDIRADRAALVVDGSGFSGLSEPEDVLDCENSGTTMRVMAGVLAGGAGLSILTGDPSLRSRPMDRIVVPLRSMGATVDGRAGGTRAPLSVRGAPLQAVRYVLPVASAQVKTCLVLAGLQSGGVTEVVSPAPSRDHTERMLAALGAPVSVDGLCVRTTAGAPRAFEMDVPGDPSSAAFFAVAAAITPGSDVVIESMSCNPTRIGFVHVLERMGADVELKTTGEVCGEPVGELRVRAGALHGTTIAGDEVPNVIDEIPVLAVAAAFADGVTDIRDASELVVKESNRIGALHTELTRLGVGVEPRADGLVVRGGRGAAAEFESHGDHRVAMAMAVGANALPAQSVVHGWRAVQSSYPEFGRDLERLAGDGA